MANILLARVLRLCTRESIQSSATTPYSLNTDGFWNVANWFCLPAQCTQKITRTQATSVSVQVGAAEGILSPPHWLLRRHRMGRQECPQFHASISWGNSRRTSITGRKKTTIKSSVCELTTRLWKLCPVLQVIRNFLRCMARTSLVNFIPD